MYIGIDGGGTKTKVIILDEHLNIIASSQGGPSGIRSVKLDVSLNNIRSTLEDALSKLSSTIPVKAVFAGLADVSNKRDEMNISKALQNIPSIKNAIIEVKNDVYNAYAAAIKENQGIILISGTGSVSFGKNAQGLTHRSGGFSYYEGDPGSAYDLGRNALKILSKTIDGRLLDTAFTLALKKHLKTYTYEETVEMFNIIGPLRVDIAEIAKIVTTYADLGDPYACKLCEEGTDELLLMVINVAHKLNISSCQIGLIGSLAQAKTYYQKRLIEKLLDFDSGFNIIIPECEPAYGAALCAFDNYKKIHPLS